MNAPATPHPPDGGRRRFLQTGVAGSALLLLGRWLPAHAAEQAAAPTPALTHLAPADAATLARLVPVVLEGALPEDAATRATAIGEILYGIDTTIACQSPNVRREIADLFGLLNNRLTRALVAGVWSSWDKASDADVAEFLASWRASRFALLRSAYVGLHNLIVGAWYSNPRSWARVGYSGPPKIGRNGSAT